MHKAQGEGVQTDPYEDLVDLEGAFVHVATIESFQESSMIGSSGFKPTEDHIAPPVDATDAPGTDA